MMRVTLCIDADLRDDPAVIKARILALHQEAAFDLIEVNVIGPGAMLYDCLRDEGLPCIASRDGI